MLHVFRQPRQFYRELLHLALPIALQNLINYSLALADTMMLGAVGQNEIAGASVVNSSFFVIMLMVFGFQSGASVLISQYYGKGDHKTVSRVMGISFFAAFTLVTAFSLFAFFFPQVLVGIFTNDPVAAELGIRYMRIVAWAYPINIFTQVYVGAQRSMGNAKLGLYIYSSAMVINTFLNYVLIFGKFGAPKLGMEGAAIATVTARCVELLFTLIYCARCRHFRLDLSCAIRPGKTLTRDFVHYATPVVVNETLWGLGTSLLPAIYGRMGTDVLAAVTQLDNTNLMCAEVANHLFGVPHVISRLYNPDHERAYMQLGIDYVCGTSLVAEDVFSKIVSGHGSHIDTFGEFEVLRFTLDLSSRDNAKTIRVSELERDHEVRIIAFERADGSASSIPTPDSLLYAGDSILACVRHDVIAPFSRYILD